MNLNFNADQLNAIDLACNGHSVLIHGPAGSGKSSTIACIVRKLKNKGKLVFLTCSTGIACSVYEADLEATTIHRYSGIDDGRFSPSTIKSHILNSVKHANVVERVKNTDVLVIDECSMISEKTFDSVAEVMSIKNKELLFGGVQIILCGDFLQLPPVKDSLYNDIGAFCFESKLFKATIPHRIELKTVIRQSQKNFIDAIREVSHGGKLSDSTICLCKRLSRELQDENVTKLFARNDSVDDLNRRKILDHPGQLVQYDSEDSGDISKLSRLTVSKSLWLKVGIPIIILRNLTSKLVNGLQGTVISLDREGPTVHFPTVGITKQLSKFQFEVFSPRKNVNLAMRKQFPIRPAFGLTIHKAQGMTLERVEVDCRNIFQPGQLGVAMSRARDLDGLRLINFSPNVCIRQPFKVTKFLADETLKLLHPDLKCCRHIHREDQRQESQEDDESTKPEAVISEDTELVIDEDVFDSEFDQIIKDLDINQAKSLDINLPEDFSIETLLQSLTIKKIISPFQSEVNKLVSIMSLERLKHFCKKQFLILSKFIEDMNITEPRKVQPKELSQFYEKVNVHLQSLEHKMDCLELFDSTKDFKDENMNICYKVHETVRVYLLQQKSVLYKNENVYVAQRLVSDHSKAKLRYVAGYCMAKLRHKYVQKKMTHRFSTHQASQVNFEQASAKLIVIDALTESEQTIKETCTDVESIMEIESRQNVSRSLTYVSDSACNLFNEICNKCLPLLIGENVSKHGENIFKFCVTSVKSDKTLMDKFKDIVLAGTRTFDITSKDSAVKNEIPTVFDEVIHKLLMVFFKQFKKDLKSSFHVEKTMAHRKHIQLKKQNKDKPTASATVVPDAEQHGPSSTVSTVCGKMKTRQKKKQTVCASDKHVNTASGSSVPVIKQTHDGKGKRRAKKKKVVKNFCGSYEDGSGNTVWVCPECGVEENDDPMICCDICDDWFHWECVGITEEPKEENWFCSYCDTGDKKKGRK